MQHPSLAVGRAQQFDPVSGLGSIVATEQVYGFHAAQIADGSRHVDPGDRVSFVVRPGRNGQWEATQVTKLDGLDTDSELADAASSAEGGCQG